MRWMIRIAGVLLLAVVALVGALLLLPVDRIAGLAESRFEAATGRTLVVEGDARPSIWPNLGIETGAIEISEPGGGERFLRAEALSIGVDWRALIGGDIRITEVTVDGPDITLRPATANAEASSSGAAPADGPTTFSIDRAVIRNGRVTILGADGATTRVAGVNMSLTLPEFDGPFELDGSAEVNGQAMDLQIAGSSLAALIGAGAEGVLIEAAAEDLSARFDGQVGLEPFGASGRLELDLGRLSGVSALAGIARPDLARGLGAETISIAADAEISSDQIALLGSAITLDQNRLNGDLTIALNGPRPRISGTLAADRLMIDGGEDTGSSGSGNRAESSGWSTAPIDVSGLGAVDLDLSFAAARIDTGTSQLGRTRLQLTLDDRRLVATIRELIAYDGSVAGAIVVNGRGGLSASADLKGSAIAISRLFAELLDFDRLIALGDMEIKVLGSGNSMNALMNSLDGGGSFRFGAGELLGLDLVGMLRNLDTSFVGEGASTIFDEITGTFRIVDGVVINENLRMTAPLFSATGSGQVGLGGQTLNYRLVPKILQGEGAGISVPVKITGTWDSPKFGLDMAGLINENAREEIEAAKDKVEQQLKDKVQERLGTTTGQSAEDALKQKLTEEAGKGLLKLFGGN